MEWSLLAASRQLQGLSQHRSKNRNPAICLPTSCNLPSAQALSGCKVATSAQGAYSESSLVQSILLGSPKNFSVPHETGLMLARLRLRPTSLHPRSQCGSRTLLRTAAASASQSLTMIHHEYSDWAVGIAVDPASRMNAVSIASLPASGLGLGANRELGAIRSFRSDRRERSGAVDRDVRY